MNSEDLRNSLRELQGKKKENLEKRRKLIKEMKSMSYQRGTQKIKKVAKKETPQVQYQQKQQFTVNEVAKGEREEKQKYLNQQVPEAVRQSTKRMIGLSCLTYLKKAQNDLSSQSDKLQKQQEISRRLEDRDKQKLQDLKDEQDVLQTNIKKHKETLFQERKQIERELAADEFRRQNLQIELQFKTMEEYFITKTAPHILWKPAKFNEGMSSLREYSQTTFANMLADTKHKLQEAYDQFSQLGVTKTTVEVHETTPSDTESQAGQE